MFKERFSLRKLRKHTSNILKDYEPASVVKDGEECHTLDGEEGAEKDDPVERLPLNLVIVLLVELQLRVGLGKAEENLQQGIF